MQKNTKLKKLFEMSTNISVVFSSDGTNDNKQTLVL